MTSDKVGDLVARLEDTKVEFSEVQAEAAEVRKEIMREINAMPCVDENQARMRELLRARYIDAESWKTVCWCLYGDADDYVDRQESFMRRCFKLHKTALKVLKNIMED